MWSLDGFTQGSKHKIDVNVASLPKEILAIPNEEYTSPSLRIQVSSLGPMLSLKVRSMTGCFGPLGY